MLVGNDVVDLHDPENQPMSIHERFDSRAFTPAEQGLIFAGRSAHALRWSLWAAKESAFKVARKIDGNVRFLPREFAVRMLGEARAEVTHRLGKFSVWFERSDGWLHAMAVHGAARIADHMPPAGLASSVGFVEDESDDARGDGDRPGRRAREEARKAIGFLMKVCPSEVEVLTEAGIPRLRRRGRALPVDLSLSHHGRFFACVWAESAPAS